jgi:hypothetical protein
LRSRLVPMYWPADFVRPFHPGVASAPFPTTGGESFFAIAARAWPPEWPRGKT